MNRISIIIPAYNEEKRIGKTLEKYGKFFGNLKKCNVLDFEILVIINNTRDRTEEIVRQYQKKFKEIDYLNISKGGKGYAITKGFRTALCGNNDLIGFVDADMATSPEAFYDLLKKIERYDGIIASRWLKESVIKTKQTFLRIITSRGFNFLTRAILRLNYSDTQCGAKLFRRRVIERVVDKLGDAEWAFDIDLLYKVQRKGFKIKEIPTQWEDQKGSKLELIKTPFQMFASIIRIRLIYSPFSFVVRAYDKLPEKLKVHSW